MLWKWDIVRTQVCTYITVLVKMCPHIPQAEPRSPNLRVVQVNEPETHWETSSFNLKNSEQYVNDA